MWRFHLEAQDTGLSRRVHGFESRRRYNYRAIVQRLRTSRLHRGDHEFESH